MYEGGDGDAEDVDESFGKEIPRGSIASKKSEIGAKSKMSTHLSVASKQPSSQKMAKQSQTNGMSSSHANKRQHNKEA